MNLPRAPRQSYKGLLWDYDSLLSYSDDECCFSLSEREIQLLLATLDPIAWKTRYVPTSTEIDQSTITHWKDNLARKLMSGCCPDNDEMGRYGDDGIYETSDDGGITWEDNPEADPRNTYIGAPLLPGEAGSALKCAAADNVRDLFKQYRDSLIDLLEAGTPFILVISGILAFIAAITGVSGVAIGLSVLIMSLASQLLTLTPEEVATQISDEVLETFKCLVFCRMEDNGQITYDNWIGLLTDISSEFEGFPETFFFQTVNGMGFIGISNAGTIGVVTADDCDDCGCDESCARGFIAWPVGDNPGATDIVYSGDYIEFNIGTDYGYIAYPGSCCYVGSMDVISGTALMTAFSGCGGAYPPEHSASPIGECCVLIEVQGSVNARVRIHMGDCGG